MKGYPGLTELLTEHDKMIKHRLSNKKQKYFSISYDVILFCFCHFAPDFCLFG